MEQFLRMISSFNFDFKQYFKVNHENLKTNDSYKCLNNSKYMIRIYMLLYVMRMVASNLLFNFELPKAIPSSIVCVYIVVGPIYYLSYSLDSSVWTNSKK